MFKKVLLQGLIISFLVFMLSASAFAAKAAEVTATRDAMDVVPLPEPLKVVGNETYTSKSGKEDNNNYSDLGFRAFSCAAGVSCISVGDTYYEYQANGTISRQIVMGSDNRVHFIWHRKGTSAATRFVQYRSWNANTATFTTVGTISAAGGGYTSIDTWRDLATAAWHDSPDGVTETWTRTGIQTGSGVNSFTRVYAPTGRTVYTGSDPSEGPYLWPVIDVDESTAGDTIVHIISCESPPLSEGNGAVQTITYFRGTGSPYTIWDDTAGVFIDSVFDIAPVVRADPNSDKVAIVYLKPITYGDDGNQLNNDVVYVESSNNGQSFGSIVNVTNYTGANLERAYTEVSAMYDTDGFLHIIWTSPFYDSASGTISTQAATLYHWSDRQGSISLVYDAQNIQNCLPGNWNRNVAKVNITECFTPANAGQPNYSADGKMLYCVYTGFFGDQDGNPEVEDCSAAGWSNGEIYVQASSTYGASWGPPINLTNTQSPGCTAGACDSENWPSSAMYVNDSLRIQYVYDTDAGGFIQTEGANTQATIVFATTPCYEMEEFVVLNASPNRFCYPFNTSPGQDTDSSFTLVNGGNASSNYTIVVSNAAIITSPAAGAGSIDFGLANAQTITLTAVGPGAEGLYTEWVRFDYNDGSGAADVQVDVDVYNFNNFFSPEDELIRTSCNRLAVSQVGRIAHGVNGSQLSYFDSPNDPIDLMFDGSIIFNYGGVNHYMAFFDDDYCAIPAPENQLLYALSGTTYDSTTSSSYRYATGMGTTADSMIQYEVEYFAPKHPDSCDFYLAHFKVTAGPNKADVSNVDIGFAADIDVPDDDAGSDNSSGFDAANQFVWQAGTPSGSAEDNDGKAVALGYYGGYTCASSATNPGGTVVDNPTWVYPRSNYPQDSLQTLLDTLASWNNFTDSLTDCNSILSVAQDVTISSTAYDFVIIFAGRVGIGSPVADLTATIAKAKVFANDHVVCGGGCTTTSGGSLTETLVRNTFKILQDDFNPQATGLSFKVSQKESNIFVKGWEISVCGFNTVISYPDFPANNHAVTVVATDGTIPFGGTVEVQIKFYLTSWNTTRISNAMWTNTPKDKYGIVQIESAKACPDFGWVVEYPAKRENNQITHDMYLYNDDASESFTFSDINVLYSDTPIENFTAIEDYTDTVPDIDLGAGESSILVCNPGDTDGSGAFDISDAVYLIAYIFGGGPSPRPYADCSGDADCNCATDISDAVYLIAYIFSGGPAPCPLFAWEFVCEQLNGTDKKENSFVRNSMGPDDHIYGTFKIENGKADVIIVNWVDHPIEPDKLH